jgi:hypothetical protein
MHASCDEESVNNERSHPVPPFARSNLKKHPFRPATRPVTPKCFGYDASLLVIIVSVVVLLAVRQICLSVLCIRGRLDAEDCLPGL